MVGFIRNLQENEMHYRVLIARLFHTRYIANRETYLPEVDELEVAVVVHIEHQSEANVHGLRLGEAVQPHCDSVVERVSREAVKSSSAQTAGAEVVTRHQCEGVAEVSGRRTAAGRERQRFQPSDVELLEAGDAPASAGHHNAARRFQGQVRLEGRQVLSVDEHADPVLADLKGELEPVRPTWYARAVAL